MAKARAAVQVQMGCMACYPGLGRQVGVCPVRWNKARVHAPRAQQMVASQRQRLPALQVVVLLRKAGSRLRRSHPQQVQEGMWVLEGACVREQVEVEVDVRVKAAMRM